MPFVFFASYSSNNRTKPLERFVNQLRDAVFQRVTPALPKKDDVTFFAPSTIEVGDEWRPRLLDALRESRVIVALCSPHYFASTYCGKEFQFFIDRRDAWLNKPGNSTLRARVIFPLIWVKTPTDAPESVRRFQDDHDSLPKKYKEKGLLAIAELKKERDTVTQIIQSLADSIAKSLLETSLPDAAPGMSIDDIRNLFEPAAPPPLAAAAAAAPQPPVAKYQTTFICLPAPAASWKPFGDQTVAEAIGAVSSTMGTTWTELAPADADAARLDQLKDARQVLMVLTDYDTLRAPASQALWAVLDARTSNVVVLVTWTASLPDAQAQQAAEQEIQARAPNLKGAPQPHVWFGIASLDAFKSAIVRSAEAIGMTMMKADPARKMENAASEQAAKAEGVPTSAKPVVIGPRGGA